VDTEVRDAVESESRERQMRHKNYVTSKVLEASLHVGIHILSERKTPILFVDAYLETINIEGEVAKAKKPLSEKKKEPKEYALEENENRKRPLAREDGADIGVG